MRTLVPDLLLDAGAQLGESPRWDAARERLRWVDIDVANRRTFVALPEGPGDPDGIAVDDEGGVWVALWDGSAVHRYAPGGEHTHTVALPTTHATACAFGGSTLYITTAAAYVASPQPHAGALFAVDAGVSGPPARPFAG